MGKRYSRILHNSGIETVFDLLLHFPVHYLDFSCVREQVDGEGRGIYLVEVEKWRLSRVYSRRLSVIKVRGRVGEEGVDIVFFNQPYLGEFFKEHKRVYIYGQFEFRNNGWECRTPMVFPVLAGGVAPVVPVYSRMGTLKPGHIKNIIEGVLAVLADDLETLPVYSLKKYQFPSIIEAFKGIHQPVRYEEGVIERLKQRFIYEEFLFFQLELQTIRRALKQVVRVHHYNGVEEFVRGFRQGLPFALTVDQERACQEIFADMQGGYTMQRLLQGDVGSGKTIVAFIALLLVVKSGFQGAFLVPTEILAAQHFASALLFFTEVKVELLTGSTPAKTRKEVLAGLRDGSVHLVVGTHALITQGVEFKNLAMVVIDEQHRFGVSQRAALYYKGHGVDLLVTTATPIPRTMLLSLYNDLSVSTIKTKPAGRLPVMTKVIRDGKRDEFYGWLRKKFMEGEKGFIILPLIESSEFFPGLRSLEGELGYFEKQLAGVKLGIVTGRTGVVEKDEILADLARGECRVLIATTVVEVGIDIRDATIMVIENADRYGLAQLHQLRGRVGRGEKQSYCYLLASAKLTGKGKERLQTIRGTVDGFEIAETDMKMRGGGIIPGLRQSGWLDFKIGDCQDDYEVFQQALGDAQILLSGVVEREPVVKKLVMEVEGKLSTINFS